MHLITVNMMDKEAKNEATDNPSVADVENQELESQETESDQPSDVNKGSDVQPVIIQKSSGKLSLLISLLALAGVAYLFYQDWQTRNQPANNDISTATVKQLQDSDLVLNTDIQNAQVDIKQVKQQTTDVERQIKVLSEQVIALKDGQNNSEQNTGQSLLGTDVQFDNSNNELALAQIQQQLADQAKTISDLQSAPPAAVGNQGIAHDVLTDDYEQIEINAAIQVLITTDVLLNTNRLPQAISALENYLQASSLKPTNKRKVQGLLNQLQNIDQPNVEQIAQQLQSLKSTVDDLQVSTVSPSSEEAKWYERFVSVKKIETESAISSTAQMVAFKTELNRLLYQAKLYLMLNDQTGWKNTLTDATKWVTAEMPENADLASRISTLSDQVVVAQMPSQLNVAAVIDQLKGLR